VAKTLKEPFDYYHLNNLETLSLLCCAFTIYCGLFYITGAAGLMTLNNSGKLFLFSIIVIVNISFFAYWTLKFLQELRDTFRKKTPKLYFMFCLCCNKKKQEKEKMIDNFKLKRNEFLKNFEKIKDYFIDVQKIY